MRILIASLFVFTASQAFAEITYQYLIFLNTLGISPAVLTAKGNKVEKNQPVKLTNFLIAPNTNYATLNITPDVGDKEFIDGLGSKVLLISSLEIITETDGRTGGLITRVDRKDFNSLPNDFNSKWTALGLVAPIR